MWGSGLYMTYIWGLAPPGPGQLATGSQTPRPPDVVSPEWRRSGAVDCAIWWRYYYLLISIHILYRYVLIAATSESSRERKFSAEPRCYGTRSPLQDNTRIIDFTF
jgi:hypothetical protein